MGKQGKPRQNVVNGSRPAPYPKKARVDVTYEGSTGPSSQIKKDINPPKAVHDQASIASTKPVISEKAKGKAKAVEVPALDAAASLGNDQGSSSTFIIIAGSYEKLLYGLEGSYPFSSASKPSSTAPSMFPSTVARSANTLDPIFIFPAHLACVKAIAASPGGKWLATGSEDEFVKVWDLRRRKEVGSLNQHSGSITSLHFPSSAHLLSTSVDGTISLFRTSDWALLKSLKGHSGRVNWVDVHPTGRVALSVGKDVTLKMWDLMRGRGAASLPLEAEAEMVKFSPRGTHFAVLSPKKVEIYSLTLKLLHTLETKSRYNAITFTEVEQGDEDVELLCVGTEKGVVEVYTVEIGEADEPAPADGDEEEADGSDGVQSAAQVVRVGTLTGHANRVKSISALQHTSETTTTTLLSTVSSDGFVHLYDLSRLIASSTTSSGEANQAEPVGRYNTKGSRLTCVFLADGQKQTTASAAARVASNGRSKDEGKQAVQFGQAASAASDEEGEEEEEAGDEGMYDSAQEEDDEEDDGVEVEFEDEEEEEEEGEEE